MNILISNDDGIHSLGLNALATAAKEFGEVYVVAPHRERSTAGHSLTLHKPLRIFEVDQNRYAATGTPADCIFLGVREVLKKKPDLILSGINLGANLGTDVHYSGTVAAAREGALMGVTSVAFSLVDHQAISKFPKEPLDFETGTHWAREVLSLVVGKSFPPRGLLNVNIPSLPAADVKGIRLARQGVRFYSNEISRRTDPRGKDYFWIGGAYEGFEANPMSDCHGLDQGYVTVTPLNIDATHEAFMGELRESFVLLKE